MVRALAMPPIGTSLSPCLRDLRGKSSCRPIQGLTFDSTDEHLVRNSQLAIKKPEQPDRADQQELDVLEK